MYKFESVLIITLFFKCGQAQLDLNFLPLDCKVSSEGAANLCEAFKTKLPAQPQFFQQLCPCIEGFFTGKSDLCKATPEPFQRIPQCYKLLSSDSYKKFVDGSKANPLYAGVINFLGHNFGVCASQVPPPTVKSIAERIAYFYGNDASLRLLGFFVNTANLGDDGLFMNCVREFAEVVKAN